MHTKIMVSRVTPKYFILLWIFVLYGQLLSKVFCLKDLKISVPEAVAVGDTVTLSCQYDLEKAALYCVRWYFEYEEFYRYVPKESPPSRVFPMQGFSVDVIKSDENTVTIRSVSKIQTGSYQCEVSADAPLFHTETSTANMIVAELPQSEPVLSVSGVPSTDTKRVVKLGEKFTAVCVSSPSDPTVNFTWTINGYKLQAKQSGIKEINDDNTWKSREAWSELEVRVDNQMVTPYNRKLIVRCETNIYSLYKGSNEIEFQVIDNGFWIHGGKVSPTTDQRSGANRGDPDNSALTGNAIYRNGNFKYLTIRIAILWLAYSFLTS